MLYGVGARFDHQPELLFLLREVDHRELIAKAGMGLPLSKQAPPSAKVLDSGDLSSIFGLDIAASAEAGPVKKKAVAKKKVAAKKVAKKKRQPRQSPGK